MNSTSKKRIIVVLGMHRSGTSAITRAVVAAGADVGENLLPAGKDNPRGFWEDRDFVNFNERLLGVLGASYDSLFLLPEGFEQDSQIQALELEAVVMLRDKLADTALFAIKDPRTCRLLPFWQRVFGHLQAKVDYVIAVRNPLSVAQSLKRRDGFLERKSHWLWLQHYVGAVTATDNENRVLVEYDRLMADPEPELERMCAALGLTLDQAGVGEYIDNFLSPDLRHTRFDARDLDIAAHVPEQVRQAYELLAEACARQAPDDLTRMPEAWAGLAAELAAQRSMLDFVYEYDRRCEELLAERRGLERQVASLDSCLTAANDQLARLNDQLERLNAALVESDQRFHELLNSRSMRITAPLRWISGQVQTLGRGGSGIL